ncbi:O-antigen ligase family protein [Vibrio breoganii]
MSIIQRKADVHNLSILLSFLLFISVFVNKSSLYSAYCIFILEMFFVISVKHYSSFSIKYYLLEEGNMIQCAIILLIVIVFSTTWNAIVISGGRLVTTLMFSRVFLLFGHAIFALSCYHYFSLIDFNKKLFISLPIGLMMICVIFIFEYNFSQQSLINETNLGLPFYFNRRILGFFSIFTCVYLVFEVLNTVSKTWLLRVLFIVNFTLCIWLGGRAAFISIMLPSLALSFYHLYANINRNNVTLLLFLLLISIFMSIPFSVFEWNGFNRIIYQTQVIDEMTINELSTNRIFIWKDALSYIRQSFYIGNGAESFGILTSNTHRFVQPHNFIIQFLFEFGIVGFILLSWMIGKPVYVALMNLVLDAKLKSRDNNLLLLSVLIGFYFQALLDGVFYWGSSMMIVIVLLTALHVQNLKE